MNTLIWGTCNTTLSDDQCQSNMASFASQLQSDCSQELGNQNLLVVKSLIGMQWIFFQYRIYWLFLRVWVCAATTAIILLALQAFQVMHDAACLIDPTINAYCYLSAVQNTNPSDLYFYSLPLGIPLPNTSKPSCSACSKNVMGIYATALQAASSSSSSSSQQTTKQQLTGLKSSYGVSAQIAAQYCGSSFALTFISAGVSVYDNNNCYYCFFGWRTGFLSSSVFGFIWTMLLVYVFSWCDIPSILFFFSLILKTHLLFFVFGFFGFLFTCYNIFFKKNFM